MFSLFESKKPNQTQVKTLFILTKRIYKEFSGVDEVQAEFLAKCKIGEWLAHNKIEEALKNLWMRKSKIA